MREGGTSDWVTGQRTLHHLAEDRGILEENGEGVGGRGRWKRKKEKGGAGAEKGRGRR